MTQKKTPARSRLRTYVALENLPRSTHYDRVEQWIRDLPLINLGETACLVHNALNHLGNARMTHRERARVLELFEETVDYLTAAIHKRYIGQAFPLDKEQQILVNFERAVHQSLVDGYRSVIPSAASVAFFTAGTSSLARIIEHALHHYFGIMLTHFQTYTPLPSGLWRDINRLYYLGETFQLANKRVTRRSTNASNSTSVAMTYKRILLTALTSPYHLSQFEISKTVALLESWSISCPFANHPPRTRQSSFFVDLFCDEGPKVVEPDSINATKTSRFLDTAKLNDMLREQIDRISSRCDKRHQKRSERALYDHLMLSWGIMPKRDRQRSSRKLKTDIAVGLRAIHHFVEQDMRTGQNREGKIIPIMTARPSQYCRQFNSGSMSSSNKLQLKSAPKLDSRSHYQSRILYGLSCPHDGPDVWDSIYPQAKYQGLKLDDDSETMHDRSLPLRMTTCLMRNTSANGACLVWDGDDETKIRIGEIIGLRLMADKKIHWTVGVIRWMKNITDSAFEFGVQYMAPACEAVALAMSPSGKETLSYQRALVCGTANDKDTQNATLIVAGNPGNTENVATLNVSGVEYPVVLLDTIDNTWLFGHYSFEIAEDETSEEAEEPDTSSFESVWALL